MRKRAAVLAELSSIDAKARHANNLHISLMSSGPESKRSFSNFMYAVTNVSSVETVIRGRGNFLLLAPRTSKIQPFFSFHFNSEVHFGCDWRSWLNNCCQR